ncbi:tail fiber assembly protein [Sediminispirochaeta smaragdinae]|uniref:Phage tail assembly chaperone-like domain-containing protein n=1 Tax=Sediminispirochaeta smaragdinae (strain DSM 11293 / JCM 15392 / SEBR 4228) TaxID=573413 RepID=E1R233_SEDSS|nr:tail fiber assembly protein [Sediminispirochaeta smaragdinae]ADK81918.1 hypothetical protein Spirs_2815 [Sediminispirochaeta smaragdinae DSM 11293]
MKTYAVTDGSMITAVVQSADETAKLAELFPEKSIKEIPSCFSGSKGDDIRFYDEDGKRLSVAAATEAGLVLEAGEHEASIWEGGKYVLVPDYTGVPYWDKATGEAVHLSLGRKPDESMTDIAPPDPGALWSETGWMVPDEVLSERIRMERDALLSGSDYIMMADYPLADKSKWKAYRQALRDIPLQPGFPQEISWPQVPEKRS